MTTPNNKLALLRSLVENAESSLTAAKKLLVEMVGASPAPTKAKSALRLNGDVEGKVVQGVFDGQNMIGEDGKTYSVPANYASKSKLVEGDTLKLTIAEDGTFIYKQIGPVERKRVVGNLMRDPETDEFVVDASGKRYKILRASITYFKANEGDEVIVLLPKNDEAVWGAVENVMKQGAAEALAALEKADAVAE